MKFKIQQTDLSKALLSASKSLLSKVNLPILANIMVSVSKNKLEILSTNLETATKVIVECLGEADCKVAVPGKLLFEFVSQLPEGEVVFEKLGSEVVISAKRYSGRFATAPVEDFPAIPKIDAGYSFSLNPGDFEKAVLRVAYSAAMEEGRPILTGILCEFAKNSLSMAATDGYRLSFQKIPYGGKTGEPVKVIMPARALLEAAKIVSENSEALGDGKIELLVAQGLNQVNIKVANVEYTTRLIEGVFPNWQKLIPTSFISSAKVPREELIKIVRVASIFARDAGSIVRFKLEAQGAKGGLLSVSAANSQVGSNEAQCEVELSGKGGEIAFNF